MKANREIEFWPLETGLKWIRKKEVMLMPKWWMAKVTFQLSIIPGFKKKS